MAISRDLGPKGLTLRMRVGINRWAAKISGSLRRGRKFSYGGLDPSALIFVPLRVRRMQRLAPVLVFCSPVFIGTVVLLAHAGQEFLSSKPSEPIALVGGQKIYDEELPAMVQGQIQHIRQQEYGVKSKALEELVRQKLLEIKAREKGVSTEHLLQIEADRKVADPTAGEVEAFYLGQKDQIPESFEQAKTTLYGNLRKAKINAARESYLELLRKQAQVVVLLHPPRVNVTYDQARVRGDSKAPIIIVEFSDFSCPFCRQAESTLNSVLAKYQGRVSLAYRDFPVRNWLC
jgi:thioredoxin family protein/SurA-like protein